MEWRSEFFCENLFHRVDIPKSEGVRTQDWKYIRYFEQHPIHEELYNLNQDPYESVNLASQLPFLEQLQQMKNRCERLRQESGEE